MYLFLYAIVCHPLAYESFYFQLRFQNNQDYLGRIWFVVTHVGEIVKSKQIVNSDNEQRRFYNKCEISSWALMVTVNKQYFQYLNILYYWTNSRQTKPDPNISRKVLLRWRKTRNRRKTRTPKKTCHHALSYISSML